MLATVEAEHDGGAGWWAAATGAAVLMLLSFTMWLSVVGGMTFWNALTTPEHGVVFVVAYAVVGLFILRRVPTNRLGPLLCVVAGADAAAVLLGQYAHNAQADAATLPFGDVAYKLAGPLYTLSFVALTVWLPLLFPDGRPPSKWLRPIGWAGGAAIAAISYSMLRLGPWTAHEIDVRSAFGHDFPADVSRMLDVASALEQWLPWLALGTLLPRYITADRTTRTQLRWYLIAATTLGLDAYEMGHLIPGWVSTLKQVPWIPLSIALAVFRHRLWGLDVIVRRSIVYGGLVAGVVLLYVAVVAGASVVFDAGASWPSFVATAVVAVVVQPTRTRLERSAERLVYGGRRDPEAALTTVGQRLRSVESTEVLPALCQAVVEAARVPWARIEPRTGTVTSTDPGSTPRRLERVDLAHAGLIVGTLTVGLSPGEHAIGRKERAVIDAMAPVVAAAVHASSLTEEVRRSRERLVNAREDERRRLRRDLHDGLGPVLAGITLEIQAARTILDVDRASAKQMLEAAESWARDAITEVRRVVYGLRPPILDQLGLVRAVEEHIATLERHATTLTVELHVRGELTGLPAAAEVATYLIALEALTNVIRHADARTCSIVLTRSSDSVELDISDDGGGFSATTPFGVGISAMRERAEELGGMVTVGPSLGDGTRVSARIPVSAS